MPAAIAWSVKAGPEVPSAVGCAAATVGGTAHSRKASVITEEGILIFGVSPPVGGV